MDEKNTTLKERFQNKKYYDFLHRGVNYGDSGFNANAVGAVTEDNVPFFEVGKAVAYMLRKYPDIDYIQTKPVRIDKPACKQLAKALQPELERLVDLLERNLEEQKQVIDAFVEQRNKLSDKDLLQSVHKKVMTDDIIRKGGEYSGVCSAVQLIRKRLIEFINISSMKGG